MSFLGYDQISSRFDYQAIMRFDVSCFLPGNERNATIYISTSNFPQDALRTSDALERRPAQPGLHKPAPANISDF